MKINVILTVLLSALAFVYASASTGSEPTPYLILQPLSLPTTDPSDTIKQSQILEDLVPPHATFKDKNGNLLPLTGAQLNALIWEQYKLGNLSGSIIIGDHLATFSYSISEDLTTTSICQRDI